MEEVGVSDATLRQLTAAKELSDAIKEGIEEKIRSNREESAMARAANKEYLLALIQEKEEKYLQRFEAQDRATAAALAATKEAVTKAETAAEKRFEGVNEFRSTLSDQQRTLMSRNEALGMLNSTSDKIEALRKNVDERAEVSRLAQEKVTDEIKKDIAMLRESRSQIEGKGIGNRELVAYVIAVISIVSSLFLLFSRFSPSPAATVTGSTITATGK